MTNPTTEQSASQSDALREIAETQRETFPNANAHGAWCQARALAALASPDTLDQPKVEIPAARSERRFRHKKRGTEYSMIGAAELQMSCDMLVDGSEMVVYRGDDGKLWVREESEFFDGRFDEIALAPAPEQSAQARVEALEAALRGILDHFATSQAPGHHHNVPGIWDADNGDKAGTVCAWCAHWSSARAALSSNTEDASRAGEVR